MMVFSVGSVAHGQLRNRAPDVTFTKYVDQQDGTSADEAVRIALANNDDLLAFKQEIEASRALSRQASQRARPSIGFETRQKPQSGRNRLMIVGSIPLELGGRRGARTLVASRKAILTEKAFEEKERRFAAEVREKFGKTLAGAFRLKLTEDVIRYVTESYDLVRVRVVDGKTAPLEENMLLVELNRLRSFREKEEGKLRVAVLELKNILGIGPEGPLLLKGEFSDRVEPLTPLALQTRNALERRTDLQVLKALEDLADARIEQAKREGKIDASLNFGYERMSNHFPQNGDNFLVFGLRIQLPYGNGNRDAIEASAYEKQAAAQRLRFGELVVRREVASAYSRYEYAVKALEIFRFGVTGEARRNLEVVRRTYEFGSASLIDYIGEQRNYVDYEKGLIDAQLELYLARVDIQSASNSPELIVR